MNTQSVHFICESVITDLRRKIREVPGSYLPISLALSRGTSTAHLAHSGVALCLCSKKNPLIPCNKHVEYYTAKTSHKAKAIN